MTDEEYVYRQDIKEKAITARSSYKVGSSRQRRCTLSTDHMTRREWEKMNGPMQTVKLNEPMAWTEFLGLSESLRKQYIQNILDHYDVGAYAIARMFGISGPYCGKRLHELGFSFNKRASVKETQRFLAAYGTVKTEVTPASEDFGLDRISVTFSGAFSAELIAKKLASFFENGRAATISIEITAK